MRAEFTNVDGVRTRILRAGSGPPVLLLHGIGLSADVFVRNIGELSRQREVIAADLPGHGFTEAIGFGGRSPQGAMARHMVRLLDVLGLGATSVVGHSFGALVGALMHFEEEGRLERLAIVASGSVFHAPQTQISTLRSAERNGTRAMREVTLDACRRRLAGICHDATSVPEEILLVQLTSYAFPDRLEAYLATVEGAIAALDERSEQVLWRLERLSLPTLVIVGREDVRADLSAHERGCERIPDARLEVMARCGHLPFLEHAARFNEVASAFLDPESRRSAR